MKKIGFLSFGHWSPEPGSQVRTAQDVLLQSIDLAVAAEELGADGAYFRVHHFARQLASPFPLLAAVGARTSRIEIGTGVIDMRYENPLYMAEDAGAADLISGGRLQLGISRGSPEQVVDGWRYFGYQPAEGKTESDMARERTRTLLKLLEGQGFAEPNPQPMFPNPPGLLRLEPHSEGLRDRIWWGAGSRATRSDRPTAASASSTDDKEVRACTPGRCTSPPTNTAICRSWPSETNTSEPPRSRAARASRSARTRPTVPVGRSRSNKTKFSSGPTGGARIAAVIASAVQPPPSRKKASTRHRATRGASPGRPETATMVRPICGFKASSGRLRRPPGCRRRWPGRPARCAS